MSVPSFSSLAGLEVAEKFEVVAGGGRGDRFQVASVSNINPSYFELL